VIIDAPPIPICHPRPACFAQLQKAPPCFVRSRRKGPNRAALTLQKGVREAKVAAPATDGRAIPSPIHGGYHDGLFGSPTHA